MYSVDIVIPTLLSKPELLRACLVSLAALQTKTAFQVYVVSNTVQSELDSFVEQHHTELAKLPFEITWRATGSNTGFTGAVNLGASLGTAPYIILLNDDTEVTPGWLDGLIDTQIATLADMVASKILLASDHAVVDSMGFTFLWRGKAIALSTAVVPSFISQVADYWLQNSSLLDALDSSNFSEPFGPDAAACLYTRSLWQQLGGMRSSLFAYLEDVDFALRARQLGYTCALAKEAIVYHHKHATSSTFSRFKVKQDLLNWWRIVLGSYTAQAWKKFWLLIAIERLRNLSGYLKQK